MSEIRFCRTTSHQRILVIIATGAALLAACPDSETATPPDAGGLDVPAVDTNGGSDAPTVDTSGGLDAPPADVPDASDVGGGPMIVEATLGARCPLDERIGQVSVGIEWGPTVQASAVLFDKPDPWYGEPELSDTSCDFHRFLPAGCGTCSGGEVCGQDGSCTAAQAPVSGMQLTLSSGSDTQVFDADPITGVAWGEVTLSGPDYAILLTGGGLTVTLPAAEVPGELTGLEGTMSGSYDAPEAVDISWDPAPSGTMLFTHIPINHHASGPTFTECAVDVSTGALHVDGAMLVPLSVVTGLEFQGVHHVRFAAAQTAMGCVEIRFLRLYHVNLL